MHRIINDSKSLELFFDKLKDDKFVAIDTEFMREKTYYPQVCLIQIAGENASAAIDPLAKEIDLSPFYKLLADTKIVKVFHACRQDIEIFYNLTGSIPEPVFDTQVAAQVCGFGESVSYENIVGKILSLPVDKSSRFTDWSLRPLSQKQIDYAMDDVIHLRKVYAALLEKMLRDGRGEWIEEEMQALLAISNYESDPNEVWKKLRLRNSSPRYLAAVRAVACWRELTAKERNLPRSRIMKDETVPEVANILPRDFASLQAIRGFYPTMSATHYQALFTIIEGLDLLTPADYPRLADKPSNQPSEAVSDLLKMLLKSCAAENQIVPRLLADKNDIDNLASGQYDDVKTLNGWRYDIFGKKALDLLAGKIAIKCDGKNNVVFEYSN